MPRPPPSSFRRLSRYFSLSSSLTPSLSTCIPYAGGEQGHRYFYRHSSFTPRSTFFLPFSFSYPPHYSSSYSVSPSFHFTRTLLSTQPLFLHLSAPLSRPLSPLRYPRSPHGISRLLSSLRLTLRDSFLYHSPP